MSAASGQRRENHLSEEERAALRRLRARPQTPRPILVLPTQPPRWWITVLRALLQFLAMMMVAIAVHMALTVEAFAQDDPPPQEWALTVVLVGELTRNADGRLVEVSDVLREFARRSASLEACKEELRTARIRWTDELDPSGIFLFCEAID